MKSQNCRLIPVFALLSALPFAAGAESNNFRQLADAKEPPQKFDRRMPPRPRDAGETESVTFLGVETSPVSPTLGSQLNLPKDAGLVIASVAPDSPAAGTLKQHDILLKLDDQLLVEPRQLSVLVRNHKEGDEVALTYIRGGKEATAKVKLGKHDVPKMALMDAPGFGPGQFDFFVNRMPGQPGMPREDADRVLGLMQHGPDTAPGPGARVAPFPERGYRMEGPGFRSTTISTANSNMVFSDDQGSLDLTTKDGKRTLVAKNTKGEQIFSGPVDTSEQRKALPPEVRERLEKLDGMQDFSFRTDDDFTPGQTKAFRLQRDRIRAPLPGPVFEIARPAPQIF